MIWMTMRKRRRGRHQRVVVERGRKRTMRVMATEVLIRVMDRFQRGTAR